MCTAMSYRNPVYLAKVAATADIISGGRVQMGIGGGWYEHEWKAYGYGFPSAGVRLARLDEGVQIMREAWRRGEVSFPDFKHYPVEGAIVEPKPLQDGGLPLWIAGGGEQKTLRLVARYADACNLFPTPEIAHKLDVLRAHCETEGRDYAAIEKSSMYRFDVGENGEKVDEAIGGLRWLASMGIQKVHASVTNVYDIKPLEIIAERILPIAAEI